MAAMSVKTSSSTSKKLAQGLKLKKLGVQVKALKVVLGKVQADVKNLTSKVAEHENLILNNTAEVVGLREKLDKTGSVKEDFHSVLDGFGEYENTNVLDFLHLELQPEDPLAILDNTEPSTCSSSEETPKKVQNFLKIRAFPSTKNIKTPKKLVKNTFTCSVCLAEFPREMQLRSHKLTHIDLECFAHANNKMNNKPEIIRTRVCANIGIQNDNVVKTVGNKLKSFIKPSRKYGLNPPHKCSLCPKRFGSTFALRRHQRLKHAGVTILQGENTENLFPCRFCDRKYKNKYVRNRHERLQCGVVKPNSENLVKAVGSFHRQKAGLGVSKKFNSIQKKAVISKRKSKKMTISPEELLHRSPWELSKPTEATVFREIKIVCERIPPSEQGSSSSGRRALLQNGIDSDRGQSPGQRGALQDSRDLMGLEIDLKPIICSSCFLIFQDAADLEDHSRSHHRALFECIDCDQTFTVQEEFQRHVQSHAKLKRIFNCRKCGEGFPSKYKLSRHRKSQHCSRRAKIITETDEQNSELTQLISDSSSVENSDNEILGNENATTKMEANDVPELLADDKESHESLSKKTRARSRMNLNNNIIGGKKLNQSNIQYERLGAASKKRQHSDIQKSAATARSSIDQSTIILNTSKELGSNNASDVAERKRRNLRTARSNSKADYQYQCPICSQKFMLRPQLKRHLIKRHQRDTNSILEVPINSVNKSARQSPLNLKLVISSSSDQSDDASSPNTSNSELDGFE